MVTRKQAEQGESGSAKKLTDRDAAQPKRKTGKASAAGENLERLPAGEAEAGAAPRRKTTTGKKTAPATPAPTEETTPRAPARKPAAKAEPAPKKTAAPKRAIRKPAAAPAEEPAPAPKPKRPAAPPKAAPAEAAKEPAAPRRKAAAKTEAAKPTPAKPTRARAPRKIEAAAATAAPGPADEGKPRPARRSAAPAAAKQPATPAEATAAPDPRPVPPRREAAQPAAAGVPIPARPPETPATPGSTRIVLMIRDPEWLYAYWEIADADRETHAIGRPQGAPPLLLRVYDMGVDAAPRDTGNSFDVTVLPDATGWYVHVPPSGGHWRVALGYLNYEGEFVAITASNVVTTPSPLHEGWNEQSWGPVSMEQQLAESARGEAGEDEFLAAGGPSLLTRRAARLMNYLRGGSGGGQPQPRLGASEQVPRLGASEQVPRLGASEQVPRLAASEQVPRLGASEQVPLRLGASEQFAAAPGSGLMMGQRYEVSGEKGKTFWLQVYTELIVYGATEPDASVTVQGQPIRLRPDGTFTLRFALPDGEQVIPVRAVNFDGDMERTITPIVSKRTV